ncbi:MAG: hypothetical protein JOS17DRAFT_321278 [Linnemannia elongata]|nr:MAG: hypothetical protein JOS17DRAFT_321278 [Linnemannia elongata]
MDHKNPTTTTTSTIPNNNSTTTTTTAFLTPANTPTAPAFTSPIPSSSTSPSSSSSPSTSTAATTTITTTAPAPSKSTTRSSSPFVRKPRPLSTSFLNSDTFSFRKNSSNSTSTTSSFSSGFPLGSPSLTPPVAYSPYTVTSSSTYPSMAPPSRGAGESGVASPAAAPLSDSGSSSRGVPLANTHYFDPRPNYGPISAHSNNSASSPPNAATTTTSTTTSKKEKKKKQDKIRSSIYHQMGIGGLTQTPRSLPYSDFLLPHSNRLGPSATAPLATGTAIATSSDQSQEWSTSGPLPPPSTSPSTFPSFQLRKSQSVGKANGTKKGIKSPFKKLRKKQGSTSSTSRDPHHALAFITSASGESDSEAGNDNEQETTTFNARGMMSRFGTGMSDSTNNSGSTTTKSKPRHAAALFDAGLPQHPFRNLSFSYSHNSGGSGSNKSGGAAGVENGGSGEGQQQQQHKEPSAARFKDLFKNVGSGLGHHHSHSQSMSAAGSPTIYPASSPSPSWDHYYPSVGGAGGAPVAGLMKSFQARGTLPRFGDFLSGDDQPSSAPRFRIQAPGRRKKKFSKKVSSTGGHAPAATDDEDSSAPVRSATTTMFSRSASRQRHHTHQDELGPRRQQNHHQHHRFLPHLHYRHRSRSFDEGSRRDVEITWRLPETPRRSEEGRSNISPALSEAQRKNQDPGVLLVELEPLPTRIVRDLAAIKSHHHQHLQQHNSSQLQPSGGSLCNFMTPSSTTASGFGSATSGPTTTHNNSQNSSYYNPQMITPLLQLQLQEKQQQKQQHNEQPLVRSKADPAAIFCTKSFLFKSYQSSRFRGHYVFRVVGDQLEYKRLPNALEESCSQYFRKADVTYRSLERKAKAIREERDERKRNTSRSQSQPQLLHQQQQQQHQLQHHNSLPLSANLKRTKSQDLDEFYGTSTSDRSVATLSSFLKEGGGLSQGDNGRFLGGGGSADKRRSSGDEILRSAVAWDYYNPSFSSAASTPIPAEVLSDSSISNSTIFTGRSSRSSCGGGTSSFANQRYNPESSSNALVRTFLGGPGTGTDRILKSDPFMEMNPYAAAAGIVSFQSPMTTAVMTRPPLSRSRKRSWSSIKEERRRQEEEEENRFKESERKYREELEQAIYGLELYLAEILKGLEYERFDAAADVKIVNENRDTAIFTLYNGDRTNIMSLESPSTKLKYEFINRIAISLMGHEEAERDAFSEAKPKDTNRHHINSFLNMSTGTLHDRSEENTEDADLLFDMIDIRLQQQEAKLQSMREDIQSTMNEIDSCLSQLDHIDERAKKMMTTMITAIDSHEIQLSLRPSPSTGLTLAETVDAKLRDVNERIVICTRIMGAARQNVSLYSLNH